MSVDRVGVVVIGRNEGDRLIRCLQSILPQAHMAVYVDSGSTDNSVEAARNLGVDVVELDMSSPFTMARGRNAGYQRICESVPEISYVQFVDGDCEVDKGWFARGVREMNAHPRAAVVCGFRREKKPSASWYNQIIDMEWGRSLGSIAFAGGDILVRREAMDEIEGYREDLIAGEDPELCVRLRQKGWQILRVGVPMTMHDAEMKYLKQWVKRSIRGGYVYAQGITMHGGAPEFYGWRPTLRIWFWALILPVLIVVLGAHVSPMWMGLGMLYLFQMLWIAFRNRTAAGSMGRAFRYGLFGVLVKWPQLWGQMLFLIRWCMGRKQELIEYKPVPVRAEGRL